MSCVECCRGEKSEWREERKKERGENDEGKENISTGVVLSAAYELDVFLILGDWRRDDT